MKFILCTGDSHTVGQYSDGYDVSSWRPRSLGYNSNGKGFNNVNPKGRDYVNLVKHYVLDHTNSKVEYVDITSWGKDFAHFRKLERPVTIDGGCDSIILRLAEKKEKATIGVYLDGKLFRTKELYAEETKFGLWSITYMMIPCAGAKEITLKAEEGSVFVDICERWTGDYAVVNGGVGSCASFTYKDELLPVLLEEFPDRIFVAEVHTINDWAQCRTVEQYRESLTELLQTMKDNSDMVFPVTVSPILWEEPMPEPWVKVDFYENYVTASYEVIKKLNLPIIDAHKAFLEKMEGKTVDELIGTLYGDKLHPAQPGYTLYAELIIEKLKDIL